MPLQGSLNDRVWVELTPMGREMYDRWLAEHLKKRPGLPEDYTGPLREEPRAGSGFVSFQLYELMCIFGPSIGITSRADMEPFKGNIIYYSCP